MPFVVVGNANEGPRAFEHSVDLMQVLFDILHAPIRTLIKSVPLEGFGLRRQSPGVLCQKL